jgi:hypothetical protein
MLEQNDNYTVSMLHMDGADQSTIFTDSAVGGVGHIWTPSGYAKITTTIGYKFGGAAGYLDQYRSPLYAHLRTPYSSDFDFGTGDFTWDLWVRYGGWDGNGYSGGPGAGFGFGLITVGYIASANNQVSFYLYNKGGGGAQYCHKFVAVVGGVVMASYNTPYVVMSFPTAWMHLAVVRYGTNFYMFINGVAQNLTVTTAIENNSITTAVNEATSIGYCSPASPFPPQLPWDIAGLLDEVRISKGIARRTSNFPVLNAPYQSFTFSPIPTGFLYQ